MRRNCELGTRGKVSTVGIVREEQGVEVRRNCEGGIRVRGEKES